MKDDLYKKLIQEMFRKVKHQDVFNLYHYTDLSVVDKIFTDDSITLRFTHEDCFEDKLEGKTVDVYFEIAINKMYKDGLITLDQAKHLYTIQVAKNKVLSQAGNNIFEKELVDSNDVYIACFTEKRESRYMVENYFRNDSKKGCRIEFLTHNLLSNDTIKKSNIGFTIESTKILYGQDIVDDICCFLKLLLQFEPDVYHPTFSNLLGIKLSNLKYAAKREKYRDENELKLILYVSEKDNENEFIHKEGLANNKKFRDVIITKNSAWGIDFSESVSDDERDSIKNLVSSRGHRLIFDEHPIVFYD